MKSEVWEAPPGGLHPRRQRVQELQAEDREGQKLEQEWAWLVPGTEMDRVARARPGIGRMVSEAVSNKALQFQNCRRI